MRKESGSWWRSSEAGDLIVGRGWPVTPDTWLLALTGKVRVQPVLTLDSSSLAWWVHKSLFGSIFSISTLLSKCDPYIKTCDHYHIECHIVDILKLHNFLSHCNYLHFTGWFLTGVHWNMDTLYNVLPVMSSSRFSFNDSVKLRLWNTWLTSLLTFTI